MVAFEPLHGFPDGRSANTEAPGNDFVVERLAGFDVQDNQFIAQDPIGEVGEGLVVVPQRH
jgi:hypothetical protein